ncbi:MAG: GxGYxYP domain-containing protein [Armatimonadota bacterium]
MCRKLFIYSMLISIALSMQIAWGQSNVTGLPVSVQKEVKSANLLPDAKYSPATVWETEGKILSFSTGRVVSDPQASGGKARECKMDVDNAGHIMYGPYAQLKPGDYVAFFRIKLLDEAGIDDDLGVIDAAVGMGVNSIQAHYLTPADLSLGKYVQIPLAFKYPGGKLECRFLWRGTASIRVDNVSLFRLEGGNIDNAVQQVPRIPQVQPTGMPRDLTYQSEKAPFPGIFPTSSKPASTLLFMDISRRSPDWQLLLVSLQGIVNRDKPVIYYKTAPQDSFWLDWMKTRGWVKGTQKVDSPEAMIAKFRGKIKGMVITDPNLASSKNIATMIAGVENAVVASPRLAKQLKLPVVADLRGKWKNNAEAYRWAFDNLWSRMNHHVAACLWPDFIGVRDYLVQHKIFIFWIPGPIDGAKLTSAPQEEMKFVEELLSKMPANIPVMGYSFAGVDVGIGEGGGVGLMAEYGKYLVGSIQAPNLSVHSGIKIAKFKQREQAPAPKLQKGKIYFALTMSDGDNLPVISMSNWPQVWKNKERGEFPLGWTISPASGILMPAIMDYYYSTASPNDSFLAAVSGVGYTYPAMYGKRYRSSDQQAVFDGFLDQTRKYMNYMDLDIVCPSNVSYKEIYRFAEKIPTMKAVFPDYGRIVSSYEEAVHSTARNIPVFHAVTSWDPKGNGEKQIENVLAQVKDITPESRPAFLHIFICNWFWDMPTMKKLLDRLGPDYIAVSPAHLAELCKQDMEEKQVIARVPSTTLCIEGKPASLLIPVQNISSKQMDITVKVLSGLDNPSMDLDMISLVPGQEREIRISGMPSGGSISIEMAGPFGVRSFNSRLRLVLGSELSSPLPEGVSMVPMKQFEAENMPHNTGRRENDSSADSGLVQAAYKGEEKPGHLVFGPYVYMEPGRYLAIFRMKRIGEGDGIVAELDSSVAGSAVQTSKLTVKSDMLPVGEYRNIPLVFDHPGGLLETRVLWPGNISMAADSISLWGVK